MTTTHIIPGQTPAHSALVLGRAIASQLKLSPLQRGRLLSLLIAEKLPAGLINETMVGRPCLALEPDAFSRTLRAQLGIFTSSSAVEEAVKHNLSPDIPTLFPLASNSWVFLPCTKAFQPFLLGAQPDIVKVVPAALWKSLAGICVTDPNFVGRLEPSFPVFKNLGSIVFANKPINFIGTNRELERIKEIVDLELFGLPLETIKAIITQLPDYAGESAEQLALEQAFLGIRPGFNPWDNGQTPLLPLSAYIRLTPFDQTSDPAIIRTEKNHLLVRDDYGEYPVDLTDAQPQPVISMLRENLPEAPFAGIPDDSVYMVSTGNGMVNGITVSFIVKINGISIMFETPAYANHHLAELGLKLTDLDYIYFSHHHADHENLGMLVPEFGQGRPQLIMSPFTSRAALQKSAAAVSDTTKADALAESLNHKSVYPGSPLILGNGEKLIKLETMDGFHPVYSSMLAVYSSTDAGKTWEKIVVYTGDTLGPRGLDRAVKAGIITPERRNAILNFVKGAKVVVVDTGSNIIHPDPDEVIKEWQPFVTGILKILHNVFEDVQKGVVRKSDFAPLGDLGSIAWTELIQKGYMVEVMGTGILTPLFTGKKLGFPFADRIFDILAQAYNVAQEAAGKLGVSGEIISLNSLNTSVSTLSQVSLLQGLATTTLLKLAQGATIEWKKRGATLIETGDTRDDRFFIIRKGTIEVLVPDTEGIGKKIILGPGQIFGERRVLLGFPANATVRSLSGCELMVITKQQFDQLSPQEKDQILGNLIKTERMRPVMQKAFPIASPEIINYLIAAAEELQLGFGDFLITEGDTDVDALYVIADGKVNIWQTLEGKKVMVAQRSTPSILGESGLITGNPRNADCVIDSLAAQVFKISAKVIDDLRKLYPGIDLTLKELVEERRR